MKYKQTGNYYKYPETIELENIWKLDEPIPDWLSDRCQVIGFNDSDQPILMTRNRSDKSIEFISTDGTILTVLPEHGLLIFSKTHGVQGLNNKQFNLLYEKII